MAGKARREGDGCADESIGAVIDHWATTRPDAEVLLAPDREPLTWAALATQRDRVAAALGTCGLPPTARVAALLPDGPELAAAFLSVSACAIFAPLDPACPAGGLEAHLRDLEAEALILPEGATSAHRAAASREQVPVLDLGVPPGAAAGGFELGCAAARRPCGGRAAERPGPDDVALLLHTSGTTSRPKQVALTHRNLCRSARHICETLRLAPPDRGLCVMPLYHVHGLVGALLSSITAGGSVACTPGFDADRFPGWLDGLAPTWLTATPTILAAILGKLISPGQSTGHRRLRLIRSSSAGLPPGLMRALEETLGVPVIEAYGMTEAAHQIASNPLPPAPRRPGSVGPAAGPEVAIMDETGRALETGATGEIVIRGPSLSRGYANDPAASAAAFREGWFRTGDVGHFDAQGYLFIHGRRDEIINRGGAKIAPREVDEALLEHRAVREAAAFAVPHPTLGQDLAAVVVTEQDHTPSESQLREFLARRLAPFKVPSRIVLAGEIPRGPSGKVQRLGLGARLAAQLSVAHEPPAGDIERLAAAIIEEVLGCGPVGRNDNFFALGGDSIRAMQVIARLAERLSIEVPVDLLFRSPAVEALAPELGARVAGAEIEALAGALSELPPGEAARLLGEIAGSDRQGS